MLLVVDANVLVSELLRRRGRDLVRDPRLALRISQRALEEARHELRKRVDAIVVRGWMSRDTADAVLANALALGDEVVAVVPETVYSEHLGRATYRVPRDPDDVPTVALALALGGDDGRCGIWTNDGDFLGCGVPTWTTETLLSHLRYQEK